MNILFVSLDKIGGRICGGGQLRSNFLLEAIRSANKDGNIYVLTNPESKVKNDGNVRVCYFDSKEYNYNSITGIFRKFYKTAAGMGVLPQSLGCSKLIIYTRLLC